ncbi:alpha/beta fold hydrolase [Vibrio sp. SCSIO 43136]|uniref:alpha/beta fold hydrolase n=1 Tax=Vibrio sp. SCSIO 43136 TaxID=2819101 RepID=UPI0020758350|nr:alpha/beta fold hydrolase [Vibrio sp. SCSIO 43136]USD64554.1 alpha/beta fold hydrolase [Vibrio sp. SCSIO 43136]
MSAFLNYKLQGEGTPLVMLHGLFGSLDNLGILARDLSQDHQVLSVDLRNHGLSFQSEQHDYELMANDVLALIQHLRLENITLVGHSMGGKVAMKLASLMGDNVHKLVVLDMAPVAYTQARHDNVIAGLEAVIAGKPTSRSDAMKLMAQHIEMDGVRQFLGKSLYKDDNHLAWRFNVESLKANYWNILGWEPIEPVTCPTLFIKGANSDYLTDAHQKAVVEQFTQVKAHVIANTGHWLHAEKPQEVLRVIRRFVQ